MKKSWIFLFAALLFTSCTGTQAALDAETPGPDIASSEIVPYKLVYLVKSDDVPPRQWPIQNQEVDINADVTGDGILDFLKLKIVYSDADKIPGLVLEEGQYILHWPYKIIEKIFIGDIDGDGDADIRLGEDSSYFLINLAPRKERAPNDERALLTHLEIINGLITDGDMLGAFHRAAELALGTPHNWSVSGEGPDGIYDRKPEVDLNSGNCVTWVEQILAMLNSSPEYDDFLSHLRKIRYMDGVVDHAMRNHFQSADWIPNNIENGYIEDVLPSILHDDVPTVQGIIDKRKWYKAKTALEGDFSDLSKEQYNERLFEFQNLGALFPPETVQLGYYPFEKMVLSANGEFELDPYFVEALPEIAIFNVVNEGLTIKDNEGEPITDLIVSHAGFLTKESGGKVLVYHSTTRSDTALSIMTKEEFLSFLLRRYLNKEGTAVGLHLSRPVLRHN